MLKWAPQDQTKIKEVLDCLDSNITLGEFAIFALEKKTKALPSLTDLENKRDEYFADLFQKHYLRKQSKQKAFELLATSCRTEVDQEWLDRHPDEQIANEHPESKYRTLNYATGILSLEGNDHGLPAPKECDKLIWPND
ncbi:hypothetical protein WDW86_03405 [Bdellovibrionota bacterium FG-2]